ncbi:MAG: AbrB/MazE/SpoVT family DNA-binding domain-containing protein [Pseudolabrys sp.]|nr:AbrB/MazE/SpoVT family DNA-binding domain-containing protein [Pseudolabrys sp.]MDP2298603.1 AbrB/MazE/SpoVT family DNA-binding domain-containing protein [Pseudolabrys sp.]
MARKSTPKGFAETKTPYSAPRSGGVDAGEATHGKRKLPPPETLPDGTVRYFLVAGPKGRVLLPADMRAALQLAEGDIITAWLKDGEVRMHSHLHGLRKIQSEAASMAKGSGYASDELVAERRAEAAKEEVEALRDRREQKKKRR